MATTPPRPRSGSAPGVVPAATPHHAHRASFGSASGTPGARLRTASPWFSALASPDTPSSTGQKRATPGRSVVVEFDAPGISALSLSPDRDHAAVASREGLFLFSLENPRTAPVFVRSPGDWAPMDIQWNPHLSRKDWIAATTDRNLVIWTLTGNPGPQVGDGKRGYVPSAARNIYRYFMGHTRTITDLDWSPHHPDLMSTAGFDSWIHVWDMRVPSSSSINTPSSPQLRDESLSTSDRVGSPVASFCPFGVGAPLLYFSTQDPNLLASSHHTDIHVWDLRKPNTSEAAHSVRSAHQLEIRGIDFSRRTDRHSLVSCGQDRAIKIWDFGSGTSLRLTESRSLEYAAWKCRWTPVGDGFVILPFGNDRTNLYLYPRAPPEVDGQQDKPGAMSTPVHAFTGHEEPVVDFVFRHKSGDSFEVVSWGMDETLRVWEVSRSAIDALLGRQREAEEEAVKEEGEAPQTAVIVEHFRAEAVEHQPGRLAPLSPLGSADGREPVDADDEDEVAWLREYFGGSDSSDSEDERRPGDAKPPAKKRRTSIFESLPRARATSASAEIEHIRKSFPGVRIMEAAPGLGLDDDGGVDRRLTIFVPTTRVPEGMFLAEVVLPGSRSPGASIRIDLSKTAGWGDIPPSSKRVLEATCRGLAKYYGRIQRGCLEGLVRYLGGEDGQRVGKELDLTADDDEERRATAGEDAEDDGAAVELPKQEDRYVPFPRLCGAAFSAGAAGDVLVCFRSPLFVPPGSSSPLSTLEAAASQPRPRDFTGYTALRSDLLRDLALAQLAGSRDDSQTASNASSDDELSPRTRRRTRRRKRQQRPPGLVVPGLAQGFPPLVPNLLARLQRQFGSNLKESMASSLPQRRGGRRVSIPDVQFLLRSPSGAMVTEVATAARDEAVQGAAVPAEDASVGSHTTASSPRLMPGPLTRSTSSRFAVESAAEPFKPVVSLRRLPPELAIVQEGIARESKLFNGSPLSICLHNQAVALAHGRRDAAGIWALAGALLARCYPGGIVRSPVGEGISVDDRGLLVSEAFVDEAIDLLGDSSYGDEFPAPLQNHAYWTRVAWRSHPLARELVANVLEALYLRRDVQTLSMLVCVLSEKFEADDPAADWRRADAAAKEYEERQRRLAAALGRLAENPRLPAAPAIELSPSFDSEGFPFPPIARHGATSPARGSTTSSARSSVFELPLDAKPGTSPGHAPSFLFPDRAPSGRTSPAGDDSPQLPRHRVPSAPPSAADGDEHPSPVGIALPRRPAPHRAMSTAGPILAGAVVGSPFSGTAESLPRARAGFPDPAPRRGLGSSLSATALGKLGREGRGSPTGRKGDGGGRAVVQQGEKAGWGMRRAAAFGEFADEETGHMPMQGGMPPSLRALLAGPAAHGASDPALPVARPSHPVQATRADGPAPPDLPLLPVPFPPRYAHAMSAYADVLLAWRMLPERAWVLKHADPFPAPSTPSDPSTVALEPVCPRCGSQGCAECRAGGQRALCALCGTRVGGMGAYCARCGHGGHEACAKGWFEGEQGCPTGCGCECGGSWG
ncbi:hypothetical protein DFJ74DRAFT_727586 [Hyaloraphidium curvatum]|nr:hypothetical protein DFJ74DRAFT_727586 [Hyaloraphidium curvatum]